MKILINAISAKKGGIFTYTNNLIRSLAERGLDSTFAVPCTFPPCARALPMAASDFSPLTRLAWEQTVWRWKVRKMRPDVLFSSANFALLYSPVAQVVLIREGGLFDPFYLANVAPAQGIYVAMQRRLRRYLMLLSARQDVHVLTPTDAMRDILLSWAPDLENRCSVNTYGTLVRLFQPSAQRPWRADGVLKALYVSVYYAHKNPSDAVLACERLSADGLPSVLRLTMTLDSLSQVRGGRLDHFHVARGAQAGTVKLGAIAYADLPNAYAAHDVFLFPSVSETFGHPMVEALASGIPVVAADIAVNREVLGDSALYYTPFRPSELAACLRRLDAEPELRARLVSKGRERALRHFAWDDHVDRLVALFERVGAKARR